MGEGGRYTPLSLTTAGCQELSADEASRHEDVAPLRGIIDSGVEGPEDP